MAELCRYAGRNRPVRASGTCSSLQPAPRSRGRPPAASARRRSAEARCISTSRRSSTRSASRSATTTATLFTPELRAALDAEMGDCGGPVYPRGRAPHGRGRLARHRLAEGVRRPGPRRRSSSSSSGTRPTARARRCRDRRQHDRPDDHAVRDRRAEAATCCPGSCRASCTSASATPSPAPAPISPRSRPAPSATATTT